MKFININTTIYNEVDEKGTVHGFKINFKSMQGIFRPFKKNYVKETCKQYL